MTLNLFTLVEHIFEKWKRMKKVEEIYQPQMIKKLGSWRF